MGLSCECGGNWDDWDDQVAGYYYPSDFVTLKTKRRQRCKSCKKLINIGAQCIRFKRFRYPRTEIEADIFGEDTELDMASWYYCADCGEIYLSLYELGFCVDLEQDDMRELLLEYQMKYSHPVWHEQNMAAKFEEAKIWRDVK